jgi:tetratricopeptide (TPR) repeat protein
VSSPARALLALLLALACCAPARPAEYVARTARAERAYAAGRYREAAELWISAARFAKEPRGRAEAEYRAAVSFERARDFERAGALYARLAAEPAPNERAARAAFALAYLEIKQGRPEHGHALLERALLEHPNSGLAESALRRRLAYLRDSSGSEAVLRYLETLKARIAGSELAEEVYFASARELERLSATLDARDAYLETASRFPYPTGAYWDDALYRAATCELRLGRPKAAIKHLERMLAQRELARFGGSYERMRYAQGRFLMAEIYRDKLGRADLARAEFRKVWTEHPTSLLADDALWNEARTAAATGDGRGTCAPLAILLENLPESRFAPCVHEVCPGLPELPARRCHDYLLRDTPSAREASKP